MKDGLYPDDVIQAAVEYVKGFHYIDDRRYAMSFIESHAGNLNGKQILDKLRIKGIAPALAQECYQSFQEENGNLEYEILRTQMEAKIKRMPDPAAMDYKERQKLFASFYRKGFSLSLIEKTFESIMEQ